MPPILAQEGVKSGAEAAPAAIEWRALDPETVKLATREERLILLSIQAPWGHWDKILGEVSMRDPNVVDLVGEKFVAVKADPLLRPDIYLRYGMGGWPTTAILLPTGSPLYYLDGETRRMVRAGGTFYSAPDLAAYLGGLSEKYGENKEAAQATAERIELNLLKRQENDQAALTSDLLEASVTKMLDSYGDWRPDPSAKRTLHPDLDSIELAFQYYERKQNQGVLDVALRSLTEMARGGIRDHLGGGFHRMSLDGAWRIPRFEKLLTVNAEMLEAYIQVLARSGNPRYRDIAEGILEYVTGTMQDPAGWFYAYQAADARLGGDGDYYTWTIEEAKAVLSEQEQQVVLPAFDIASWGEMVGSAPRRNVLFIREGPHLLSERLEKSEEEVAGILESGRRKMAAARAEREPPAVGRVLVTEANASMAAALILAGGVLDRDDLREAGSRALVFLLEKAWNRETKLASRAWSPVEDLSAMPLFFADQVQLVRALLVAFESTGDPQYLQRAREIAGAVEESFADTVSGGYMDRIYDPEAPGLLGWPMRSITDNARYAEQLLRLERHTGVADYRDRARKTLESWADELGVHERASRFGLAVDRALNPPVEVLVVGSRSDEGWERIRNEARALYHPWKVVRYLDSEAASRELASRQMTPPEGASGFVCLESRCAAFTGEGDLKTKLAELGAGGTGR